MPQRYTIQAVIYQGEEHGYVAECLNLAVVTQGKTLDDTVQNLREAIQLHLEGEDITKHAELDTGTIRAIFRQASAYIPEDELKLHFFTK